MANLEGNARTQASLGARVISSSGSLNGVSSLILGRVKEIDYQQNSVSYTPVTTDATSASGTHGYGYKALLPVNFAGRNGYGSSYGEINPIRVNDIVLIGFVDSKATQPIVLGRYADTNVSQELSNQPSPHYEPADEDTYANANKRVIIYPDQSYDIHDGEGNRALSFSGRSFVLTKTDIPAASHMTDDGEDPVGYEDLNESYDGAGNLREPISDKAPEIIMAHTGIVDTKGEPDNHKLYVYVAQDGTYRVSVMQEDQPWRTYFEETPDGAIHFRRQEDSKIFGTGSKSSEIGIDKDGNVTLRNQTTGFVIKPDGIYNPDGTKFNAGGGDNSGNNGDWDNSEIGKILLKLQNTVIENDKRTTTLFEVMAGEFKSVITQDNLVGSLAGQLGAYQKQLDDLIKTLANYETIIGTIAADSIISTDEKKKLADIWSDLASAHDATIDQAEKYAVDHTDYDNAYAAFEDYISPILADMSNESLIDGQKLIMVFNALVEADTQVNKDIFMALADSVSLQGEELHQLRTTIDQTASKILLQADAIDSNAKGLKDQEAKLKIMADQISSTVSKHEFINGMAESVTNATVGHANLLGRMNDTIDQYLDSKTGELTVAAGGSTSEFIKVSANTHYSITVTNITEMTKADYVFYDASKKYISGAEKTASSGKIQFTRTASEDAPLAPANAAYLRFGTTDKTNQVKIERSYKATDYIDSYVDAMNKGDTTEVVNETKQEAIIVNNYSSTASRGVTNELPTFISSIKENLVPEYDEDGVTILSYTLGDKALKAIQDTISEIQGCKENDEYYAELYGASVTTYDDTYTKTIDYLNSLLSIPPYTVLSGDLSKFYSDFSAKAGTYFNTRQNLWLAIAGIAQDAITKAVQELQDALNNYKSKTEDKFTAIIQTADSIKLIAQKTSETVRNLKVGGTNIILHSDDTINLYGTSSDNSNDTTANATINDSYEGVKSLDYIGATDDTIPWTFTTSRIKNWGITTGTSIAISFDYTVTGTRSGSLHVGLNAIPGANALVNIEDLGSIPAKNRFTQVIKNPSSDLCASPATRIKMNLINVPANTVVSITKIKLEIGNLPTDWAQAPTDLATKEWSKSYIDVSSSGILLSASSGMGNLVDDAKKKWEDQLNKVKSSVTSDGQNYTDNQVGSVTVGSTNLINNGNFSKGNLYWTDWGTVDGSTRIIGKFDNATDWPESGGQGLKLVQPNNAGDYGVYQGGIKVIPNTYYSLSAYVDGVSEQVITLSHTSAGKVIYSDLTKSTPGLEQMSSIFKTGPSDKTIDVYIGFSKQSGNKGSDNISLVQLEKGNRPTDWHPSQVDSQGYADDAVDGVIVGVSNLVNNGNFARGNAYWDNWSNVTGGTRSVGSFTDATEWPTNGGQGLILNSTTAGSYGLSQTSIRVQPKTSYTFSAYVSGSIGQAFTLAHTESGKMVYSDQKLDVTGIQHVVSTFKTGASDKSITLYIGFHNQSGKANFSLVKFEKGTKSTEWTSSALDNRDYTSDSIDNIKLGGNNLIVNSRFEQNLTNWSLYGATGDYEHSKLPDNTNNTLSVDNVVIEVMPPVIEVDGAGNTTSVIPPDPVTVVVSGALGGVTPLYDEKSSGFTVRDNGNDTFTFIFNESLQDGYIKEVNFTDSVGSSDIVTVYCGSAIDGDPNHPTTTTTTTTIDDGSGPATDADYALNTGWTDDWVKGEDGKYPDLAANFNTKPDTGETTTSTTTTTTTIDPNASDTADITTVDPSDTPDNNVIIDDGGTTTTTSTSTTTTTTQKDPLVTPIKVDGAYWPYHNRNAISIQRPSGVATTYGVSQLVYVMPDTEYTLSCYWSGTGSLSISYGNGSLLPQVDKTFEPNAGNSINRDSVSFKTPENVTAVYVIFAIKSDNSSDRITVSLTQLEKGNKLTDWGPSSFDVNEKLDRALSTAYASWIAVNPDNITSVVTSSSEYASLQEYLADKADTNSLKNLAGAMEILKNHTNFLYNQYSRVVQTAHDWTLSLTEEYVTNDKQIQDTIGLTKYMKFDNQNYLTIGNSISDLEINITNDRINFTEDGAAIAYISSKRMVISGTVIKDYLVVGRHKISKDTSSSYKTVFSYIGDLGDTV